MLERKTALITGAASGIGFETAVRFSRDEKYNPIYALDKDPAISAVFEQANCKGIIPFQIDLRDRDLLTATLRRVAQGTGRLDVVVNAAGVMSKGRPSTYWNKQGQPTQEFKEMESVDLMVPIVTMVEASGIMHKNGGGTIINITSAKYLFPDIHHIEYQRLKRDLSRVTRGIAKSFMERDHVRVVDVQPGCTKTNIDRKVWTPGSNTAEINVAQSVTDWWRNKFGNDPRDVAEVIYQVAEGKIKGTTVNVGLDSKLGRLAFLVTYPLAGYRWDIMFFLGSTAFYLVATWGKMLKDRFSKPEVLE